MDDCRPDISLALLPPINKLPLFENCTLSGIARSSRLMEGISVFFVRKVGSGSFGAGSLRSGWDFFASTSFLDFLIDKGVCFVEPLNRGRLCDLRILCDFLAIGEPLKLSLSGVNVVCESRALGVVTVYPESRFTSPWSIDAAELASELGCCGEVLLLGLREG